MTEDYYIQKEKLITVVYKDFLDAKDKRETLMKLLAEACRTYHFWYTPHPWGIYAGQVEFKGQDTDILPAFAKALSVAQIEATITEGFKVEVIDPKDII